jgi:hypothetical protein
MTGRKILGLFLQLLFLIGFNVVFYVLGGSEHNTSTWLSYTFIHVAYVVLMLVSFFNWQGGNNPILHYPLISIALVYFIVEFIVGVVLILIAPENFIPTLLIQLILLLIFTFVFIANLITNKATSEAESKHELEIDFKRQAAIQVKLILDKVNQPETKRVVEKAFDALNSSPVKSNSSVSALETQIIDQIHSLAYTVETGDHNKLQNQAQELISLVSQRNAQLKRIQ